VIDASAPKKTVAKRIWDAVNARIEPPAAPASLENVAS
jgi:hypothetical protein